MPRCLFCVATYAVAVTRKIAKPHQSGEEEHGDRSQFQHLSETREFPDKTFRVPERGRSLEALDDVIAGAINQYAQRTGANEF